MTTARDITRTAPFWLVFAASTLGGITNSASTPLIPVYVGEVLGGGVNLAGGIISLAAAASMLAMPIAGLLGDRYGYRLIAVVGSVIATLALVMIVAVPTLWGASLSRILFGLGSSAATTLIMTWLVASAPPGQRGRGLSIYGLSVWIGLALGPQIGTAVNALADARAVFAVCAVLELFSGVLIVLLPRAPKPAPRPDAPPRPRGPRGAWRAFVAVWAPGVVAAAAWCGEGLMLGFLIIHLSGTGIPATGITGAASVFAVFAVSVIVARLFLASLPDRIGPLRATAISLIALTAGLATLALAGNFWVAAAGAALIGIGFSPLYPSLTMLATRGLHPENRALGLGLFSSFTSIGYGGGAVIGGAVIASAPSMWAFLIVAALQLIALAVLTIFTRDDSPRARPDAVEPRDPAA